MSEELISKKELINYLGEAIDEQLISVMCLGTPVTLIEQEVFNKTSTEIIAKLTLLSQIMEFVEGQETLIAEIQNPIIGYE